MKKVLFAFLIMAFIVIFASVLTFIAEPASEDIVALAEENASVCGNIKKYIPFEVNGKEIRLFAETTLTADEAMRIYANAYDLISKDAIERGITASVNDPEFQEYAKIYAFYEGETDAITQQVADFVKFIDLHENTAKNKVILQKVSKGIANQDDLDAIMPACGPSTDMN